MKEERPAAFRSTLAARKFEERPCAGLEARTSLASSEALLEPLRSRDAPQAPSGALLRPARPLIAIGYILYISSGSFSFMLA